MYTRVSIRPATPVTKELTMRVNPSDVLLLVLAALTLLGAASCLGGLLAAPFGG